MNDDIKAKYIMIRISRNCIEKYYKEKDFYSCIFYILKLYFPKIKLTNELINKLKNDYFDIYYKYNDDIDNILRDLNIIFTYKNNGYDRIENYYKNKRIISNLDIFFNGGNINRIETKKILPI